MAEPWLTIIGIGEDGPDGLSRASRDAIDRAEVVAGAARHLALLGGIGSKALVWPVPFADGIAPVMGLRGRPVVVLASGDPFWFGAGSVLTSHLAPGEWVAHPGPSCFSLAAARLGWRLEEVTCLGLHAAPLSRLRPHLATGARLIVTLRDGAATGALVALLAQHGFADSTLWLMECLGGPRERLRRIRADAPLPPDIAAPLAVALDVAGPGPALPLTPGLPDGFFEHDGQITKQRMRALTLAALAPRPGELLWDIGAGSGSISIEWLLCHPSLAAVAVEADEARAARIARNAANLGMDRLQVAAGARARGACGPAAAGRRLCWRWALAQPSGPSLVPDPARGPTGRQRGDPGRRGAVGRLAG